MEAYPNFDSSLNSNSNDINFADLIEFMPMNESQQRQATNGNRNSTTVSSTNLTSQASHNFNFDMLPTPENTGSDAVEMILSPYNMMSSSGHLTIENTEEFFLEQSHFYLPLMSPQTSPTLSPDASMNIANSLVRRNNKRFSPKNSKNNNVLQSRRKSSYNINDGNKGNGNSDSNSNGQNNPIANLQTIVTAPSLRETMPNLNLGSNLVSDVTNTHSSSSNIIPNESSSSGKISPITPSSLMKINSARSGQNEQQQNQQKNQDQQQLQLPSKDHSAFIAPTSSTQLNNIRVATTGAASPSNRKSNRSASSPLAGPSKSPHSLKPTISPNLKPKLPGALLDEVAAEQLAKKSNYRSILEGTAQSLGISYSSDVHSSLESRRTTHKAAEQKRRDSLKQSFDELKKVVPLQSVSNKTNSDDGNTNNNSKSNGKPDSTIKNVSKLILLKRAHDHIVELEQKSKEKDELIQKLKDELDEIKGIKRRKIEEKEEKAGNEENTKTKDEQQATLNLENV